MNTPSPIMEQQLKSMKDVQDSRRENVRWTGIFSGKGTTAPFGDPVSEHRIKQRSAARQGPKSLALRRKLPNGNPEKPKIDNEIMNGPYGVSNQTLSAKSGSGGRSIMKPIVMEKHAHVSDIEVQLLRRAR